MSAIAGVWRFDGNPEAASDCARMLAAQEVYGPHDGRQWSGGPLALGRRLFRTLPEDLHDLQPLQSRDGRLVLVADVRLDNRDELTAALRMPAESSSLCDAAVLLESLVCWGEAAVDRLVGDFAFALWEPGTRQLLLARDFSGLRPLHYHRGKDFFAFASMPKGLHALPAIPKEPDEHMVAELIALLPQTGSRSFFKTIHRVEPGCCVTVRPDRITQRRYWEPRRPGPISSRPDEYIEGLRHHLDQATASRLRGAGVAVAAQLSSGLDSSSVAATAARLLQTSGGRVVAFTAVPREGYDGPCPKNRIGDEGPLAAATASMYPNVQHVLVRGDRLSPMRDLDGLSALFEQPMLNLCNFNWARAINDGARQRGLTVLLNGHSGNSSLSYTGFELLPELLAAGRFADLWRGAAGLIRNRYLGLRSVLVLTLGPFLPSWFWKLLSASREGAHDILSYTAIRRDCLAELDLAALAKKRGLDFSYRPWKDGFAMRLWSMGRIDMGYYSKGTLAGWGLDRRDPTADKRLVEYCLSVPAEEYIANGTPRSLARRALADRLPGAILDERRRGYQAADWHESLTAARDDVLAELDRLAACPPARNILDVPRMKGLAENWPCGGWGDGDVVQSYRGALLRGLSAGHFLRLTTEGSR